MHEAELRLALARFLGEDRYRKFVRELNTTCDRMGRLLYWQQDAWGRFSADHPEWEMDFESLRQRLRVCWVHGSDLRAATIRAYGPGVHLNYIPEYTLAWSTLFPNSYPEVRERTTMGGMPVPLEWKEVRLCSDCLQARAKWEADNA